MGTPGPPSRHTLEETLDAFARTEAPGAPLTTREVADELDCARRTAYGKLESLAERGDLETKKVGARGRVWWRVPEGAASSESSLERAQFDEFIEAVTEYAIFVLDDAGRVQTWNEGARRLKGYETDEIVGEHFSAFYTEADREAGRPERNLETAAEAGQVEDEGWRVRKDGTRFWANVTITALYGDDGDVRGYAKVTRDMTERHEYEEELRAQRDELDELDQINAVIRDVDQALVSATTREEIEEAVCERLAASDTYSAAWTASYADDAATLTPRTAVGVSGDAVTAIREAGTADAPTPEVRAGETALRTRTARPIRDADSPRERSLAGGYEYGVAVPLVYEDAEYGVLLVYAERESAFDQRKRDVLSELGETVGHAIAARERKERERTLTALQQTARELLRAETPADIGDVVVETLTTDLELEAARVYAFDTAENTLDAVGARGEEDARATAPASLEAGADSPIWSCFVDGTARAADDALSAGDGDVRDARLVPLGDHGVLAVATPADGSLDADTERLVELVAATTEAAFDRVESQRTLRERDDLLQERNQRLQRLNQVNTVIRSIDQGLVRASTRAEVQRVVCERLTESERFRFAWVGAPDDVGETLVPEAHSGAGRGYLDSVERSLSGADAESETAEPAVRTLAAESATVVSNVAADLRRGRWRREAFSREFQSAISVPLRYGEVTYGVLAVYADRPGAFDEMEQSVFVELGETIANAIHAVETKRALLGDRLVEVDVRLEGASTDFLGGLARDLGGTLAFEGVTPASEGRVRVFFHARDASVDAVREALERAVAVESGRVVSSTGDAHLVEAVASGSTVAGALSEYGASLRSLRVTDGDAEVRAVLAETTDVREFVEWLQSRYEGAEFLARRERERAARTREDLHAELDDALTERQREVLETAYYAGFFQTPRRSTGRDVAAMLDVSQPTVSEQLRVAQRKVLDVLLDDGRGEDATG